MVETSSDATYRSQRQDEMQYVQEEQDSDDVCVSPHTIRPSYLERT